MQLGIFAKQKKERVWKKKVMGWAVWHGEKNGVGYGTCIFFSCGLFYIEYGVF